ncbi:MAG: hypothetical protein ABRQ25_12670 [Clostridiaceae bacterium]
MFSKLFKKKNSGVSMEVQLNNLKEIGISLNSEIKINKIFQVVGRKDIETEPYVFLLIALGSEIEIADGQLVLMSDDVWYFDSECIEDSGIYVEIIERLFKMSKGYLRLDNIDDYVDIENNEAWVSFDFNQKYYRWDLKVEDDWFDMTLIQKINRMLIEHGYNKKFAVVVLDQTSLIGFFSKEQLKKINDLTELKFEFYC